MIDTTDVLTTLLDSLHNLPTSPPSLHFDIEGVHLGRAGTISIIQLYVLPQDHVYLIDVHILDTATFSTTGSKGQTLKSILEDPHTPKVFFDVRNDSDALHGLYGIKVAGIHDIQLMENGARRHNKRFLNSLDTCIERDASLPAAQVVEWKAIKDAGKRIYAPEKGGSYDKWHARPLMDDLRKYCVQDVTILPLLWERYTGNLSTWWAGEVRTKTLERVAESLSEGYNRDGAGKHVSPWAR